MYDDQDANCVSIVLVVGIQANREYTISCKIAGAEVCNDAPNPKSTHRLELRTAYTCI